MLALFFVGGGGMLIAMVGVVFIMALTAHLPYAPMWCLSLLAYFLADAKSTTAIPSCSDFLLSLTCFPHSGHLIKAIIYPYLYNVVFLFRYHILISI